jgi:hypothetical protein
MSIDNEKLIAFADGELKGAERAEVEAALAADPALRAKLEKHKRLRKQLSAAFDSTLDEPMPAHLRALIEPQAPAAAPVIDLAERRAARWSVREWGALAASTVFGLFLGVGVMHAQAPMVATSEAGLVARGALAQALETQLASDEAGAVRIGLSFRNQGGGYCRTFELTDGALAGLACRDGERWGLAMTAASHGGGELRTAGAPAEILAAVDAMIDGEVLDAESEAQARDAGWD